MNEQRYEANCDVQGVKHPVSRFLTYGSEIQVPDDPDTVEDFLRAHQYLETITAHFLEFGPLAEKTAADVAYELDYHNRWHQYEVEQNQHAGIPAASYRAISLVHLRALSKRRLLALAEAGSEDDASLSVAQYLDQLIEQAVAEEEALNGLTTPASR
jgi:hypothetical protein